MDEIWTIKRCMEWTEGFLGRCGEERPRLAAEWLLGMATGFKRIDLYMNMDRPLSSQELAVMHDAAVRRRGGEPLQYILGETSFRTIDVTCERGVLIPRPETEMLVELVLEYLDREILGPMQPALRRERVELPWNAEVDQARQEERARLAEEKRAAGAGEVPDAAGGEPGAAAEAEDNGPAAEMLETGDAGAAEAPSDVQDAEGKGGVGHVRRARVLEVGCGTGCISLSIASERADRVLCVATDIDAHAVGLARRNRERLGISPDKVDIRQGDLTAPVTADELGTFDVLVSNPPYIPSRVMPTLPVEVRDFEPSLALDGGEDGLDIFRRLLSAAPRMLSPGGLLACELFEDALDAAAGLCRAAGMEDVRVASDLARRPRFVLARMPRL